METTKVYHGTNKESAESILNSTFRLPSVPDMDSPDEKRNVSMNIGKVLGYTYLRIMKSQIGGAKIRQSRFHIPANLL